MDRKRIVSGSLIFLISFIFLLGVMSSGVAASEKHPDYPVPKECLEQAKKEGKLHIYDYAEWWPEEIYTGFEKEFGIKIVRDNFASTDEMVAKFRLDPNLKYDVVLPATREFAQLKALGVLQKINHDWIPNVNHYYPETMKKAFFDPDYQYSVGTDIMVAAYVYNTKFVDQNDPRIPSWELLYEGKEYAGRITMIDDMFYVIGCALKYLGFSYNSNVEEELMKARELLLRQKPYVMAYEYFPQRLVVEEEAWIVHTWNGEAWFYNQDVPTTRAALPTEGSTIDSDLHVIPKAAPHPAAAHLFINYLSRPEIRTLLAEGIGYSGANTAADDMISEEMKNFHGVIIPPEYLEKCEFIKPSAYTGKGLELRTKIWEDLKK